MLIKYDTVAWRWVGQCAAGAQWLL